MSAIKRLFSLLLEWDFALATIGDHKTHNTKYKKRKLELTKLDARCSEIRIWLRKDLFCLSPPPPSSPPPSCLYRWKNVCFFLNNSSSTVCSVRLAFDFASLVLCGAVCLFSEPVCLCVCFLYHIMCRTHLLHKQQQQ